MLKPVLWWWGSDPSSPSGTFRSYTRGFYSQPSKIRNNQLHRAESLRIWQGSFVMKLTVLYGTPKVHYRIQKNPKLNVIKLTPSWIQFTPSRTTTRHFKFLALLPQLRSSQRISQIPRSTSHSVISYFPVSYLKPKAYNIQNYNLTCCFVLAWNVVSFRRGRKWIDSVW
jgi:hypothetical protein